MLAGWPYYNTIPITAATGAGTDYQRMVDVYKGSGTNAAGVVYLGDKCSSFPNDIRFFYDNSGVLTELDHWYETNIGSDVTFRRFWVKVAQDLSSVNRTIYICYGKSGAATAINGANTFNFFRSFATGDLTDWSVVQGAWNITNGYLNNSTTTTPDEITKTTTPPSTFRLRGLLALLSAANPSNAYMFGVQQTNRNTSYKTYVMADNVNQIFNLYKNSATALISATWTKDTNYHTITLTRASGGVFRIYIDDVDKGNATDTGSTSWDRVSFESHAGGLNKCLWTFLSKFVSPEPAVGIPGAQQTNRRCSAFFQMM